MLKNFQRAPTYGFCAMNSLRTRKLYVLCTFHTRYVYVNYYSLLELKGMSTSASRMINFRLAYGKRLHCMCIKTSVSVIVSSQFDDSRTVNMPKRKLR